MAKDIVGSFLWQQINSGYRLDEYMQTLGKKLEELSCRETDINSELEKAEILTGRKRKREVENWLRNVEKKRHEIQSIEQELGDRGLFSRIKLGNRAKKMIGEMEHLVQQGSFPEGLIVDTCETRANALLTTRLVGQTSRRNLEKVWTCLTNDDVLSIGIYGMGGVGKTTLTMHIHNCILECFESSGHVYWVTVSRECSIYKLQNNIAKVLGHDISDEEDETRRAALLFKMFITRRKSVLILDDMWDHFPLEKVGIPIGANGIKLILTTRSLHVCHRMGCQEMIKVEPLSREESWTLFMEKLEHGTSLPDEVEDIARSVVDRCAGLPLGIITMAGAMRGINDIYEWRNVLEEFKEPMAGQNDMGNDVFPLLKFSYDCLKDSRLQLCFLYCALYPEDSYIERQELIEYFIAEGLIEGRNSRQAELNLGHSILNKLENACLVESVKGFRNNRCIKMHDLIRELALQITRTSPHYMVKAGRQLRELPPEQEWSDDLEKVSLMKNEISKIPSGKSPSCPKLSTLILRDNPLERLPYSFLLQLQSLAVLDLSRTEIQNLPSSLSDLKCLSALLLHRCEQLIHVPSLAELRELQILDLSYTRIKRVPQGLENLVNLKELNMHQTRNLEMMPTEILPRLSSLQQLMLDQSCKRVKVRAEELTSLRHLEEFEGQLYDLQNLVLYVRSQHYRQLNHYRLLVRSGECENFSAYIELEEEYEKEVRLANCSLDDSLVLPHDIQYLEMDECQNVSKCLCDVSLSLNNRELKACAVIRCDGIDSIISPASSSHAPFQSLEKLDLHGLQDLSTLYEGGRGNDSLPKGTFLNLKHLDIIGCPRIKTLFTLPLLQNLQNLEVIYIWECKLMEEIIALENQEEIISFPKLIRLSLQQLPELKSICRGKMACESIQNIAVVRCPKLKRLPFSTISSCSEGQSHDFPLEEILVEDKQWWESLEWDHLNLKQAFQPFVRFW
ncbi:hypothetical protein NMG60_11037132 [Bertholletia excelsa]